MPLAPATLSLREFARLRGLSHSALRERAMAGSLPTSVAKVKGRWVILDPAKAVEEWEANTRHRNRENGSPSGLAIATQKERENRARMLELQYEIKTKTLVRLADYEQGEATRVIAARTNLLGLPTRAKQRLPHLTIGDLAVLDALVREALEELADGKGGA